MAKNPIMHYESKALNKWPLMTCHVETVPCILNASLVAKLQKVICELSRSHD